jgi:hypothetical protein
MVVRQDWMREEAFEPRKEEQKMTFAEERVASGRALRSSGVCMVARRLAPVG